MNTSFRIGRIAGIEIGKVVGFLDVARVMRRVRSRRPGALARV